MDQLKARAGNSTSTNAQFTLGKELILSIRESLILINDLHK